MDTLEIRGPHGWLQIYCVLIDAAKSPVAAKGYQHLRYAVGGLGFSGQGDGFVAEDQLRAFCKALVALAKGEDVQAQLSNYGAEAGGLALTLRNGPNQDRLSVDGRIVTKVYQTLSKTDGTYTWAAEFGFWVPRDALSVGRVRWIENYAGVNTP
jgi:hypothetical protein